MGIDTILAIVMFALVLFDDHLAEREAHAEQVAYEKWADEHESDDDVMLALAYLMDE